MHASTMISCSGTSSAVNSCYASQLVDFNSDLYWWNTLSATNVAVPAAFNGDIYNTTWDATVSGVGFTITGDELRLAENYAVLPNGSGGWMNGSNVPGHPFLYNGMFDAPTTAGNDPSAVPPGAPCTGVAPTCYGGYTPGDALVGMADGNAMVIGFNESLLNFGFRVSSNTNSSFNLILSLYSSSDGSGTPLQTINESYSSGGGTCPSVFGNPPVPCNNAPFFEIQNLSAGVHSIGISTNDPLGFYIDTFDFDEVPEPSTVLLSGIGIVGLVTLARRRRNARHQS